MGALIGVSYLTWQDYRDWKDSPVVTTIKVKIVFISRQSLEFSRIPISK